MNFKTNKIMLNKLVEHKKDFFSVEDSIIIPDIKPDVLGIITTSSNLCVYKKEINNGRIKIDGGIIIDTIYTADDEKYNTRALHNTINFSKMFDIESQNVNNFSSTFNIRNINPKIVNGRKVSIEADIEYEIKLYSNSENEFICSIDENEDVQKISRNMEVSALGLIGESICNAKDNITTEDSLQDILGYNLSIMNREEKVSYNKVLSKADCKIDIIYINEEDNIRSISQIIPVTGFIDMPGIDDEEIISTNYEVRNIDIKMDSASNNKILVDVEYGVRCESYENNRFEIIEDLYSPDYDVVLKQSQIEFSQNRECFKEKFSINEQIDFSDVKDNNILITNVSKDIFDQKIIGNSVMYEASIRVDCIFESNATRRWEQKSKKIDFSHAVKFENLMDNSIIDTDLWINNVECNTGTLSLDIELNINKCSRLETSFISDIQISPDNKSNIPNSIVIYFVKDGDTLWKIAKKFKTTIEEIAEVNNIDDVDKIKVGEQLLIPRHVNAKAC